MQSAPVPEGRGQVNEVVSYNDVQNSGGHPVISPPPVKNNKKGDMKGKFGNYFI